MRNLPGQLEMSPIKNDTVTPVDLQNGILKIQKQILEN